MNTLDSLFQWTLSSGIRASLMVVAVLGIQAAFRRRLPAKWRHALWFPVLLVLVLPVLPSLPFSPFGGSGQVMPMAAGAAQLPEPAVDTVAAAGKASAVAETPGLDLMVILPIAWLAVAVILAGAGMAGHVSSLRKIKRNGTMADARLKRDVAELAAQVGLRRPPVIRISSAVESPAVTGVFRPLLLLPKGFPDGFTATEARLILVHELTHLKRHDLEVNALLCVVQALHWYNPVLWFAFSKMRADRETACDAAVLSSAAEDHRSAYGHALLKLQDSAMASGLGIGFVGIFKRGSALRSRIQDIGRHHVQHRSWNVVGAGMVALLGVTGATKAPAVETVAAEARKGVEDSTSGTTYINHKLDSLVIPAISFEGTSVEEAVDFLRLRAKELDVNEKDPTKKGVNFVIRKPRGVESGRITWSGKEVTLRVVLAEVARRSDLKYVVDDFRVTLLPEETMNAMTDEQIKRREKVRNDLEKMVEDDAGKAAAKIILPVAEFMELPLKEAVAHLNKLAAAVDPNAPKVVLGPKVDDTLMTGELRLRNVPLTVAIMYLCDQTKLEFKVDGTKITLNPR